MPLLCYLPGLLFELDCSFPDQLPGTGNVARLGLGLSDTKANSVPVVEGGMGKVQLAALVQSVDQCAAEFVSGGVAEADQIQRWTNSQFKPL